MLNTLSMLKCHVLAFTHSLNAVTQRQSKLAIVATAGEEGLHIRISGFVKDQTVKWPNSPCRTLKRTSTGEGLTEQVGHSYLRNVVGLSRSDMVSRNRI